MVPSNSSLASVMDSVLLPSATSPLPSSEVMFTTGPAWVTSSVPSMTSFFEFSMEPLPANASVAFSSTSVVPV